MSQNINYGLLKQGFVPKPLSKITQEDIILYKEFFGQDVNSTPMNPLVKFDEVTARQLERLWVECGNYHDSDQVDKAEGRRLWDILHMIGLEPKSAQSASAKLTFYKTASGNVNIPEGTIVDNKSTTLLKEFEVDDDTLLPSIFVIQKGTSNGSDAINGYPGFTNFFNVESVEWVSDNKDGSSPYILTTDYTVTDVGGFKTAINWSPGGSEPTTGNVYYVKVGNYRAYIDVTAVDGGDESNAEVDEIFNLQSPIGGIGRVTNEEPILNGRNQEEDISARKRAANLSYIQRNDDSISAFLSQLHRVDSASVITELTGGNFRSIIYSSDSNSSNLVSIFNEAIQEAENRKGSGANTYAMIRIEHGSAGGTDQFPIPYSQTKGVSGTYQILWVASDKEGSSRYVETTDYVVYSDFDNELDWSPGGAEPGAGGKPNYYWVKAVRCVEIADETNISIEGRLVLRQGYDLTNVSDDLFIDLSNFIKPNKPGEILYLADIIGIITDHEGVKFVDNLKITMTQLFERVSGGAVDAIDMNGSGFSDFSNDDINWVNDKKDQSGTSYTVVTDFLWEIISSGKRGIDWSPGGSEPTAGDIYYASVDIRGDLTPKENEVIVLDGVTFTE